MKEILELIYQMSPYILLGFLLAGLMHAFVPNNIYRKYLGGNSFRTVFNAALLGVPLPLCSCGVIPTAMSLRREGASKGATVAFLISTPQTGVDSIIATYSLMGLPFALLRPFIAFITAICGGFVVNKLDKEENGTAPTAAPRENAETTLHTTFTPKIGIALRYAFIDMMQDIGKWLMMGLVIAGLITVFVPDSFFATFIDKPLLSMLIVLAFAIPMYLCATGSIPIAVALMLKGLTPGAALVMLMAGPAVNAASILVIGKVMGKRTLRLYLASIIGGAILFGLGIDYLLPREWFIGSLSQIHNCAHAPSYFNIVCTLLLMGLLINAFILKYRQGNSCNYDGHCGCNSEHTHATCDCGHSDCSGNKSQAAEALVIRIKGMSCNHCKANVEKAIRSVTGVSDVDVNLNSGNAVVQGSFDKQAVKQAVEGIGFDVE